jgi:hypothetical protein
VRDDRLSGYSAAGPLPHLRADRARISCGVIWPQSDGIAVGARDYKMIKFLSAHSDAVIALFSAVVGAVLGCFGSYWIWWLERRRQRRMARMQTVINLRRWMKRSLDQILDMQTHESSGGAGGAVHLRIPNFRFEKSLEIIALLEPGMAEKIFGLIDDKDNANAEVQADTEERHEDTALDTFRGRSAQAWLTAWGIYRKVSGQIGWSDQTFSDKDKGTMQEESDRFDRLKKRRAEPNELF